jgi:hypothetical protein
MNPLGKTQWVHVYSTNGFIRGFGLPRYVGESTPLQPLVPQAIGRPTPLN